MRTHILFFQSNMGTHIHPVLNCSFKEPNVGGFFVTFVQDKTATPRCRSLGKNLNLGRTLGMNLYSDTGEVPLN